MSFNFAYTSNNSYGTLTFPQSDYNNEISSTRFNCFGPGTGVLITDSSGGTANTSIDEASLTELTNLWYKFVNGSTLPLTSESKKASGATLGFNRRPTYSVKTQVENPSGYAQAIPGESQRELKWRITLQDTVTGDYYTNDIPCCNASILQNNSELMPEAQVNALKAFLAGPSVQVTIGSDEQSINIPMVVSNRGNPLSYVTSSVVGVRFKKN